MLEREVKTNLTEVLLLPWRNPWAQESQNRPKVFLLAIYCSLMLLSVCPVKSSVGKLHTMGYTGKLIQHPGEADQVQVSTLWRPNCPVIDAVIPFLHLSSGEHSQNFRGTLSGSPFPKMNTMPRRELVIKEDESRASLIHFCSLTTCFGSQLKTCLGGALLVLRRVWAWGRPCLLSVTRFSPSLHPGLDHVLNACSTPCPSFEGKKLHGRKWNIVLNSQDAS